MINLEETIYDGNCSTWKPVQFLGMQVEIVHRPGLPIHKIMVVNSLTGVLMDAANENQYGCVHNEGREPFDVKKPLFDQQGQEWVVLKGHVILTNKNYRITDLSYRCVFLMEIETGKIVNQFTN